MQGSHDKQTFMVETYWNKKIIKATVTVSSNGTVDTEGCKYHGKIQDSRFKHHLFRKYTVIHNGKFIMSM